MNYKAFENLELIPQLLEKIQILEKKINLLESNLIKPLDLTTRKNVKKYLAYNRLFEQCFQKYLNTFDKNIF